MLKERLSALTEAVPAAQKGDVRSVHQARVATRRLREALPVFRAGISSGTLSRVERQVRKMTRALGPVRELDVALEHLARLSARNLVSARALSRVRQAVARDRLARRREMLAAVTPGKLEKLRQKLLTASNGEHGFDTAAALARATRQTERRAGRLLIAIDRAGGLYLPDRLHQVRIAAKKLRYALEIQRELKRSRSTARINQLKRLQDLLGDMHDAEMLIDRTRRVQAELAPIDRKLTSELDIVIRALEAECRRDHAAYMRRRASIVTLCESLVSADETAASAVA